MNNPTIYKIEYRDKSTVAILRTESLEVSDDNFSGAWEDLEFAPNTADLTNTLVRDSNGNDYNETTIRFFVPGTSVEQKSLLSSLAERSHVYRITDGEGKMYVVGTNSFRTRFTFGEVISATAAGKKGYDCVITCKSLYGPLVWFDETGSGVL